MNKPQKTILCVAMKMPDEIIYSLPRPNRHHDLIRWISEGTRYALPVTKGAIQGFLDSDNNFVSREEAKIIATEANQLLSRASVGKLLFSECVW